MIDIKYILGKHYKSFRKGLYMYLLNKLEEEVEWIPETVSECSRTFGKSEIGKLVQKGCVDTELYAFLNKYERFIINKLKIRYEKEIRREFENLGRRQSTQDESSESDTESGGNKLPKEDIRNPKSVQDNKTREQERTSLPTNHIETGRIDAISESNNTGRNRRDSLEKLRDVFKSELFTPNQTGVSTNK